MTPVIRTKRLLLSPMTDAELRALTDAEQDPEMRAAYGEMLAGAQQNPAARNWFTAWRIALRGGPTVGDLCFKGGPVRGAVEVGYGILPPHQGKGYATEAVNAIFGWACAQPDVYFVTAETAPNNVASQRVLARAGFQPDGQGKEGPRFVREKPPSGWTALYTALGMGVGAAFGASDGSVALGAGLGLCAGAALGAVLDTREQRAREALRAARATAGAAPDAGR